MFEIKDLTAIVAVLISCVSLSFSVYQYMRKEPEKKMERARASIEDLLIELHRTDVFTTDYQDDNWEKNFTKMDLIRNLSASCVPKIKQVDAPEEVKESVFYIYENSKMMRRLFEDYISYTETQKFSKGWAIFPKDKLVGWPQLKSAEAVLKSMTSEVGPKRKILEGWLTKT